MGTLLETLGTNLRRRVRPRTCHEVRSRFKNNTEKSRSRPLISHHPHNMVTINHQDTNVGQDNDHLHLPDSHFSQDDQRCDNSSSLSQDRFSLSNTISSVDLTTWGPDVRRHNQSGRSMGSTDTTAVVTTRRGLARASQVWQDGRYDRTFNMLAPHLSTTEGSESICQVENCTKCQQRLTTEKRDYWKEAKILREKALEKEEMARRMEEQKNRAFRSAPRRPRPRARVPTLEQMDDQLRNDHTSKLELGVGSTPRAPTAAVSSSTNDHLKEVLKGQAQQAEFLQHIWVQQSQMQQALQQQVCALTGAIQQLAETQQAATAWTSEETRRKTSRG